MPSYETPLVVCLCGLPGAGKTTLCKLLKERSAGTVLHICFDEYLEEDLHNGEGQRSFDPQLWHQSRKRAFTRAEVSLQSHEFQLILLDDNMHLRSMRRESYKLACKYEAGFAVLYIPCSLDDALKNNVTRKFAVSDDVVHRMAATLEPPDPIHHSWERHTIIVPSITRTDGDSEVSKVSSVWAALQSVASVAPNDVAERARDEERKVLDIQKRALDREATASCESHAVDNALKKEVGRFLREFKDQSGGGKCVDLEHAARVCSDARKRLFNEWKSGGLGAANLDDVLAALSTAVRTDLGLVT